MAGSIKWMGYTQDNGDVCAMRVDESNGEQGGFVDVTANGQFPECPRSLKPRYVNGVDAAGGGRLIIGDPTNALYTDGGEFTANGRTFAITSSRGEKGRRVVAVDTGVVDGDPT